MEEEIRAEFKKNGFILDDDDVISKCLTFCIEYNLSPLDLVTSWEVFSLNRGLELTVKSSDMGAFLQHLQSEQRDAIIKKEPGLHFYSNDIAMILNDEHEDMKEDILGSPTNRPKALEGEPFHSAQNSNGSMFGSRKPLESVTPFGQRKSKFVVQFTLNEPSVTDNRKIENEDQDNGDDDDVIKRVQPMKRCSLQISGSQPEPGCRFMYDRIEDKFNFLENRMKKHARALVASGLFEEPRDPTVASQRSLLAVGMICCEEEGRLKEMPILLQSSVEHSGGQRVRLDLQNLDHFSIFPGQVIGVEGHNPSGHCLIASKIIDHIPSSVSSDEGLHPAKKQAMNQELQRTNTYGAVSELSLIVAAGPFTTTDNLFFEPLTELLAYARRKQPQLLVLLGPFIDSDHPEIKKATVHKTFDEIFQEEIVGRLKDYVEYMGSSAQVILVPSIRDAHHDFVFPQPAFDIQASDTILQINSISNPGTFCANEVKVACCTVDILKHLSAEEISRNPQGGSKQRMSTLANHVLNQHSFYPLYPPAESIPLDFSLAPETLQISLIPDILILPSDLAHFVRVLSVKGKSEGEDVKCICVNPGRLARGEGGGFFVELNYNGSADSASASVIRV
ncbi:DNA polymerase alpha subunit B [Ipomoea triloba]|uniref:DNA polymerase alpha subunit B n=1 Tax=Ipomoea triloba TaxID=35885 RepID=UPI00125DE79B|nr:DNA polymerase alpha subunit B [Ipomoea triloba]XP_031125203.1 DNA polymerase alpha subunit B [Ipomoea triloba]